MEQRERERDITSFIVGQASGAESGRTGGQPEHGRGRGIGRAPHPQPGAKAPAPNTLKRNDTSFAARATAKLRELYEQYLAARATGEGPAHHWASLLKYYQYLVRAVMSDPEYGIGEDGNARGILVYHEMGMGKTRLAVAVTMAMWDTRQPVVMLARSLQKNFRETVREVVAALNPGASPGGLAALQKEAEERFVFVSMDAYNSAEQLARASTGAHAKRGATFGATSGLDGKLFVVDEAHNFFRAIINSSAENSNARRIYDMVMTARNLRIVFLTGTPAAKDPFELVPCFNMLTGTDLLPTQYEVFYKLYVDRARHAVLNRERLANRLAGLVSHVTHARPSEPSSSRAGPSAAPPRKPRDNGWFPEERPMIIERVEMGPDQYRQYLLVREKEEAEGKGGEGASGRSSGVLSAPPLSLPGSEKKAMRSYYVKSRSLSNFAPPRDWSGASVDAMPDEVFAAAAGPKLALIAGRADKAPGPILVYSQFVDVGGLKPLGRFLQRLGYAPFVPVVPRKPARGTPHANPSIEGPPAEGPPAKGPPADDPSVEGPPDGGPPDEGPPDEDIGGPPDEDIGGPPDGDIGGPPDGDIGGPLAVDPGDDAEGPPGEPGKTGGLILGTIDSCGRIRTEILPRRRPPAKRTGTGGAAERPQKGYYAVISGEVPSEERDAIKIAFNSPANAHGAIIKAILVSKTGAEGLDLKFIRETHQLEPYWDKARDDQVKSRAVRMGSHDGLEPAEREVQPYLYIAVANRGMWEQMPERNREDRSIDELFHARAHERYETNRDFRDLLVRVSLECEIFGYGACRVCVPTNAPLFHDDPSLDVRLPDPCEIRRETDVVAKPVRVGGVTYYYIADPAESLGYRFFVYRGDLGGYAPLDPSDAVVPALLRDIGAAAPS